MNFKPTVLETVIILVIGLMPPLLSIWFVRRAEVRARARLTAAIATVASRQIPRTLVPEQTYLEGVGYLVGDITCQFNARSAYLRCAVNPAGPCRGCRHYESLESLQAYSVPD